MEIRVPGGVLGDRPFLNLQAGSGITITGTDDPVLEKVDITISGAPASNDFGPEGAGMVGWTFDIAANSGTGATFSTGVLFVNKIQVPKQVTVSNVWGYLTNAGNTLTSGQNFAGIYSSAGSLLATTADQTTAWGTTGMKTMALTSTPSVGGNPTDFIWVVVVSNGTGTPAFLRSNSLSNAAANLNTTTATSRYASILSGQTSLPSSFTPGSLTQQAQAYWFGIS